MKSDPYYTITQCALSFKVSNNTIRQWLEQGLLKQLPYEGKVIHIDPESVEQMKKAKLLRKEMRVKEQLEKDIHLLNEQYQEQLAQLKDQVRLYGFLANNHKLIITILTSFFEKIIAGELRPDESQALAMALAGYNIQSIAQHFGYSKPVMTRSITRAVSRIRQNVRSYSELVDENEKLKSQNTNIRSHYRILAQAYEDYKAKVGFPMFKYSRGGEAPKRKPLPHIYTVKLTDADLNICSKTMTILTERLNLRTVSDLVRLSKPQLLKEPGIGRKTLIEIDDALAEHDLRLGTDLSNYDLPITNN